MRTTVQLKGMPDLILEKAVKLGIARSKTDALRMGVFSLNKEFDIVKDLEIEMVGRRIRLQEEELKRKGKRNMTEAEVKRKYGFK